MSLITKSNKPFTGDINKLPGGLLDKYPGAAFCFSLERRRAGYSGPAIRVRRASDNAELDIPFLGNFLNEQALTDFTVGTDGYITVWYGQDGVGINAVQATAVAQPQIASGGAVLKRNGKPAVYFRGSSTRLDFTAADISKNISHFHIFGVAVSDEPASGVANARVLIALPSDTGSSRVGITDEGSVDGQIIVSGRRVATDAATTVSAARTTGKLSLISGRYHFADGLIAIKVDDADPVSTAITAGNTANTSASAVNRIGSNAAGTPGNFWLGGIAELVGYASDQTSRQAGIENYLKSRYGT